MVTNHCNEYPPSLPSRLSKVAVVRAHEKYKALFDVIGPAKINVAIDLPFLPSCKPNVLHINESNDFSKALRHEGTILICPLLMRPIWDQDYEAILNNVLEAYDTEEFQLIKERDYALLNELRWFLIYKFSTSLDWEGSVEEARTVVTLQIFAALLHFHFNEDNIELIVLKQESFSNPDSHAMWCYTSSEISDLFNPDIVPEMDDLLKEVWASMVNAANKGKGEN